MSEDFSNRLFRLIQARKSERPRVTKARVAKEIGASRTMLYNYEQGDPPPPAEILSRMEELERQAGIGQTSSRGTHPEGAALRERPPAAMIPVVSWAHAGDAEQYEELPQGWQRFVPTECRDERAFAVELEGDSMEPRFGDGDVLVLMPGTESHSGCYAVCRFREGGGVLFRRVEFQGAVVQLIPLNERYEVTRHECSEFEWIYPVWGRWTQLWKR